MRQIALVLPFFAVGCGNLFNQHAQTMDAMRGVMADTAARLGSSGAGQVTAGGEVIHPGIRVSAGIEYYAEARYVGVAGQVQASMTGRLDRAITPESAARAEAIWRQTDLSSSQKLERLFNFFRDSSSSATVPGPAPTSRPFGNTPPARSSDPEVFDAE